MIIMCVLRFIIHIYTIIILLRYMARELIEKEINSCAINEDMLMYMCICMCIFILSFFFHSFSAALSSQTNICRRHGTHSVAIAAAESTLLSLLSLPGGASSPHWYWIVGWQPNIAPLLLIHREKIFYYWYANFIRGKFNWKIIISCILMPTLFSLLFLLY